MKELYLLPKHQFDLLKSKNGVRSPTTSHPSHVSKSMGSDSNISTTPTRKSSKCPRNKVTRPKKSKLKQQQQQWGTHTPPTLPTPIHLKGFSYNRVEKPKNSNLHQQLGMKFFGKNLSHARVVLDHLEKSGIVEWNDYGDMTQPLNGYNILTFMEDIISKDKIGLSKVEDYKFLINATNLPLDMVKNKDLKSYLMQNPPSTVIGKSGKLFKNYLTPIQSSSSLYPSPKPQIPLKKKSMTRWTSY